MFDNDDFLDGMGCLGVIVMAVLLVVFAPMLSFVCCYFGGWLCKITFGPTLCNALNTLFNVSFFTPEKIPLMAGALGWIGNYFRSEKSLSSIDNKKRS